MYFPGDMEPCTGAVFIERTGNIIKITHCQSNRVLVDDLFIGYSKRESLRIAKKWAREKLGVRRLTEYKKSFGWQI